MKKKIAENLSKSIYDCGKVSFTIFVVGVLAKQTSASKELVFGIFFTLAFFVSGAIIDWFKED